MLLDTYLRYTNLLDKYLGGHIYSQTTLDIWMDVFEDIVALLNYPESKQKRAMH